MRRWYLTTIICTAFISLNLLAQPATIEFVESIPVETTLDNPDIRNTLEVWLEIIHNAKKSIDLEQFYLSPQQGETLDQVIAALVVSAQKGVQVRIIADSRMYKTYPAMVDSFRRMDNFAVRVIDFNTLAGSAQHAKYLLADEEVVFIGSQNFDWRALSHIHELGIKIYDTSVASVYQELFDLDWQLAAVTNRDSIPLVLKHTSHKTPMPLDTPQYGTVTIQPTYSPRQLIPDTTLWDEIHISRLLSHAQKEICLQFLSYSPRGRDGSYYAAIDGALRKAADRGVHVRLLVSDWQKGSSAEAYLKELAAIPNIQVKFSSIPDWSGGYVSYGRVEHCKYILVDGEAFWLGTSNGEKSYFYTSRNAGMVITNELLAERLEKIFYKSWDSAYTETIDPSRTYAPRRHGDE